MVNLLVPTGEALDPAARFGIVVARFNESMTTNLMQGAIAELLLAGIEEQRIDVAWVPGAWEIPFLLQQMSRSGRYAALIALGVVIRGETTHDRQINRFVSLSIGELSLKYNVPIGMGLLTCKTSKQAERRSDPRGRNKGGEAARAALELLRLRSILHD
jgi:6,7-dimethyl-8-ribityllumazine synthase